MSAPADPHLISTLLEPLHQLRSAFGDGAPTPTGGALQATARAAQGTEGAHTRGLHALESTWTGEGADHAVPAIRALRGDIQAVADRGTRYAAVLSDAQDTSRRAGVDVDGIISSFRSDARALLGAANSAPETDAVIDRGARAIRSALSVVHTARGEMDGHRRRLHDMGPLGASPTTPGSTTTAGSTMPLGSTTPGSGMTGSPPMPTMTPDGKPIDPALLAQMQLQQLGVQAGVQLGSAAIDAGVQLGSQLIDRIADVGNKAIDQLGAHADTAIQAALDPKSDNTAPAGATNPPGPATSDGHNPVPLKAFDFGAGVPPAPSPVPGTPPRHETSHAPHPTEHTTPHPAAPDPPHSPTGGNSGMFLPPGAPPNPPPEQSPEKRSRPGQLGVTVPSQDTVAPVLGESGQ